MARDEYWHYLVIRVGMGEISWEAADALMGEWIKENE